MNELPDIHAGGEGRGLPLEEVGVRGVPARLAIVDGEGELPPALVHLALSVSLAPERRGAHLSRLGEAVWDWGGRLPLGELPERCADLARRLEADAARIEGDFPLVLERRAPVSRATGWVEVRAGFRAAWSASGTRLVQRLEASVATLCPCSKAISENGAHNQRCRVSVELETAAPVAFLGLLEAIESSGSCRLFPVLKRADEKWVTEAAYARPAFVEDVARDVVRALAPLPGRCRVAVQSQESIHPHDAYAVAERR